MADTNLESYVLMIKTIQISPLRTLLVSLKDILLESNITFTKDGITIINMDKSCSILCNMHLKSQNFEFFDCKKEKIVIGVNMFHLFKLMNSVDNDDTLIMYIEEKDYSDGVCQYLSLKFENGDIKQCKTQKLRLIEPDAVELKVPDVTFSSIITLPSSDFQKIIRDLASISERLEIKSVANELIFKCEGMFATAEVRRCESDGNMNFKKNSKPGVIQGCFSLKNLNYFVKCTNLCNQIELYLENDLPLIVDYSVASLGSLKLALAPLPSTS